MSRRFLDEFFFWVTLALGITLFSMGFSPLFKVVVAHSPVAGLREAAATPTA